MVHPITQPSHVAVLVPSVRKAAAVLRDLGFTTAPEEEWAGEGTREIYVEEGKANPLLLMEPIKPGAYQRALEKRGPGLHHLAIDVLNLHEFLLSLAGSGWLLHPQSVGTMARTKTAYLARPGFPALIEVQERKEFAPASDLFVRCVRMPVPQELNRLPAAIGLGELVTPSPGPVSMELAGQKVDLESLYAQ